MRKAYDPFLRVLVKRPGLPLRAEEENILTDWARRDRR